MNDPYFLVKHIFERNKLMMKLVKFYTKLFVKTPIFILSLVFSMYIFIFQLKSLNLSILEYTSVISYAIIASNLFF